MDERELYWLAGVLEGEGSFCKGPPSRPNKPFIAVEMTDEDIVCRVSVLFGRTYKTIRPRKPWYKPSFVTKIGGVPAIELMRQLFPLMGKRRQCQIQRAIQSYHRSERFKLTASDAQAIRRLLATGMRQSDIAEIYGVHRTTVVKINTGAQWISND